MAQYFFEISEGSETLPDNLGSVCRDDETAILYAYKSLADCVGEPTTILPWQHAEISVTREDGVAVARISMTVEVETENPASVAARNELAASGSSTRR